MCRDYIRDDFYFEECIRFTQERINKFEEAFKKLDDSQTEQRRYCLEVIAGFEKNMIHLMYSAGRKKAEIAEFVSKYLDTVSQVGISSYNDYVDVLSFSILFDRVIDEEIRTDEFEDGLTEYLRTGNKESLSFLRYEEFYGIFRQYIIRSASLSDFADYMENKWYPSCKDFSWYETHEAKGNIYVGYWSWLAAAILKKTDSKEVHIKYVPFEVI